jgi:hypothetical protein
MNCENNEENLFSETYSQARAKFQATATKAGLTCTSHVMKERGVEREELAIDVVCLGAREPRQVVMISSGAHGVEGFAGSAIQIGLMATDWAQELPDDMAVVLVHALNPHGMSWSRRECEDGTDLTRNVSHHLYPPFPNEQYELFHPLLVPADVSAETLARLPQEYERILTEHEFDNPGPILRIGQYAHADGLTYHGLHFSWPTKHWIEITRQYAHSAEDVMLIDIHTGFGDYGDLLVQNPSYHHSSPSYATLCEWLGREPAGYSDDGSIIEHRIETFEALHRQCKDGARVAAMYFEFGTKDPGAFIDPWVRNNWYFHYGDRFCPEAVQARRDFADFCYVRKPDWKRSVWEKGLRQLEQLCDRLSGN